MLRGTVGRVGSTFTDTFFHDKNAIDTGCQCNAFYSHGIIDTIMLMFMSKIQYYDLKPADRILSPKSLFGIIQHHAVYLGRNYQGQDLIAENAFGKYVRIVTAEEFFREYPTVTRIDRFQGSEYERTTAIQRALDLLNQPYSLISFNCEHYVNVVQFNKRESKQIGWALLLILLCVVGFISGKN